MKRGFHFFAYLSRMKYIMRWGLMRNIQSENIQEHSLQVAMIAHVLALIKNIYFGGNINSDRIAVLAMYHDASEIITGDMPTPIKYFNPDIKKVYKDIEEISKKKLLTMLPEKMSTEFYKILIEQESEKEEWKLIKAADRLSAYIKCREEVKAGNAEFQKAGASIFEAINKLEMPEVQYFIDNFLPSYELSLDELE